MTMAWGQSDGKAITVTVPDRDSLLSDLGQRMAAGEGFAVATLNLDHAVKLSRDTAFRAAYAAQTHVTADGNPVVWLSRLAGQDVSLVTGSDLVDPLLALAARLKVRVAFFGSQQATLDAARDALQDRHPGLEVVLALAPAMGFDPTGDAAAADLRAIGEAGTGLCLLALGAPKQEILAARGREMLPGTGFVSIGAGLDFVTGRQQRAPAWVRRLALEWLWRMLRDPGRLAARYGACLLALPGLTARALRSRGSGALS